MTQAELITLARQVATSANLYPAVICGMCQRESSWNPYALRYEPFFYLKYVAPLGLLDPTEAQARGFSWGLMQTMGQVVREAGYKDNLAMLCDPETALIWGCKVFEGKLAHADGNVTNALLLWNGGGNPNYAAEVLEFAKAYS